MTVVDPGSGRRALACEAFCDPRSCRRCGLRCGVALCPICRRELAYRGAVRAHSVPIATTSR